MPTKTHIMKGMKSFEVVGMTLAKELDMSFQ
jgi:hypothetical protein